MMKDGPPNGALGLGPCPFWACSGARRTAGRRGQACPGHQVISGGAPGHVQPGRGDDLPGEP